jgi:hypothetical protein
MKVQRNRGMGDEKGAARISTTTVIRTSIFQQSTIHGLANAAFGTQTFNSLLGSDVTKHLLVGHGLSSILEIIRTMYM